MADCNAAAPRPSEGPWLYVAELMHRVCNEYASAIAVARVGAARSRHPETRAALNDMVERLHAFAKAHRLMQPPTGGGMVDLVVHLASVTASLHRARLAQQHVDLQIVAPARLPVEEACGWRLGLIVSELVTNAARHALPQGGGTILVALAETDGRIAVRVEDSVLGRPPVALTMSPGTGTRIVDALAAEIGATVERRFSAAGSAVTVTFPSCPLAPDRGGRRYGRDRLSGMMRPPRSGSPATRAEPDLGAT